MSESTGTVDPTRVVPEHEVKALVTIETAERLMVKAYNLLNGGDEQPTPETVEHALLLLDKAIDITTSRTATAVKRQDLSDEISRQARFEVNRATERIDRLVAGAYRPQEAGGSGV